MKLMPVENSPDSLFMSGLNEWCCSDKSDVRESLTRLVSLIAYPIIVALSAIYNALAFTIKTPLTLARYTVGFIPTSEGKLRDFLPEDTNLHQMALHIYKVLFSVFDLFPFYLLALINPKTNIALHQKLGLHFEDINSFEQTNGEIDCLEDEITLTEVLSSAIPIDHQTQSSDQTKKLKRASDEVSETLSTPLAAGGPPPPPPMAGFASFKPNWKNSSKAAGTATNETQVSGPKKIVKKGLGFDPKSSPLFALQAAKNASE